MAGPALRRRHVGDHGDPGGMPEDPAAEAAALAHPAGDGIDGVRLLCLRRRSDPARAEGPSRPTRAAGLGGADVGQRHRGARRHPQSCRRLAHPGLSAAFAAPSIARIATFALRGDAAHAIASDTAGTRERFALSPNIYWIVLDGYPRQDVLAEDFKFDNSGFIQSLRGLDFTVLGRSRANFPATINSISSTTSSTIRSRAKAMRFGRCRCRTCRRASGARTARWPA